MLNKSKEKRIAGESNYLIERINIFSVEPWEKWWRLHRNWEVRQSEPGCKQCFQIVSVELKLNARYYGLDFVIVCL